MYYFVRRLFVGVAVSASLAAAIGFPTYVLVKNYTDKQTLAEDSTEEEPAEKVQLLSFFNWRCPPSTSVWKPLIEVASFILVNN